MDSQESDSVEFVTRRIWTRFWYSGDMSIKGWSLQWRQVPANYSPPIKYPAPSTDPRLIKYSNCEAFFKAVTEGKRKTLIKMLNTHGPEVTTELSKSYNEHVETPLLVAIKNANLNMVKYLVGKLDVPLGQIGRFLWRDVEYNDVPALYVAIVSGEMDIAAYLLSQEVNSFQTAAIVESIVSSPTNQRQEKINILELMGAFNFYFYESDPSRQNGLVYWRAAMNLRHSTIDGEPTIPKTIVPSDFVGMNFGFTPEFTTLEQLEQYTTLQLFTQAILVGQRILNVVSPGPHQHQFILTFLCQCASVYFYREEQRRYAITILMFFLQQLQELYLQEFKNNQIIIWALDLITEAISSSQAENPSIDNAITSQEEFTYLMAAFDFAAKYMSVLQVNRHRNEKEEPKCLENLARYILGMIFSLNELMPKLNLEECQQFENSLSLFIRKDHRWGIENRNLLHTICDFSDGIQQMPQPRASYLMAYHEDDESSSDSEDESLGMNSDYSSSGDSSDDLDEATTSKMDDDENNQQDVSSLLSPWRNPYSKRRKGESDVEGCSSCGHGGGNSSDEDDPNFELIRNYDEVPEDDDDDNDADADDNDEVMEAADEDNDDDNDLESSCTDLHISTTQLILRLGADPNATDFHGCTALHLLAKNRDNVAYSRVLMEYGAHIDQPDVYNSTPLMLFQEWQRNLVTRGNPDLNLQLLINHGLPLPLTCLAARVLSQNQIPFEKEKVPLTLHSFIQRH